MLSSINYSIPKNLWYSFVMSYEFPEAEFRPEGQAFIDIRLLDQLTSMRELCMAYANKPSQTNSKLLTELAQAHLKSIRIALDQLEEGSGGETNANDIVAYAKGLEIIRVNFLNELADADPEYPIYEVAEGNYDAILDHLVDLEDYDEDDEDDDESVADLVYTLYQLSLSIDLNKFANNSTSEYEQKPETRRKRMIRKIGKQALDVAKISVGVFIGMAAASKIKKH